MRAALLDVSRNWLAMAAQLERLPIVREINSVPMRRPSTHSRLLGSAGSRVPSKLARLRRDKTRQ